ncbi:bifunctional epoxide hydrolase 2-like [Hordeum vulgare]|nr:bifunctional epoxide hydrolase 2-like [Hordeum vulgare]
MPLQVFVVGHDWGALIAWYLCLFRPDRVTALVSISLAFMRNIMARTGPDFVKPTDYFNSTYGPDYYICRFQEPGVAEARQFAPAQARRLLRQIMCHCFSHGVECDEEMHDDKNCELAAASADAKVQVPTKYVVGDGDITYHFEGVKEYIHGGGFKENVPLLEEVVVLPGAGHFIQQERAQEVSDRIYDFIAKF